MLLGAFVAVGVEVDAIADMVGAIGIPGLTFEQRRVHRCSLHSVKVEVVAPDQADHRRWQGIDQLIADAEELPESVQAGARKTFRLLGEVEAAQHGVELSEVHFHEVGALDAIADIVGVWSAWHLLGEPRVVTGTVGLGGGTVAAAHGSLPLPAPATLSLLEGVPVRGLEFQGESVTPTGAALLVTLSASHGEMPAGVIARTGRGAGGRDPETHPNVVTAVLLDTAGPAARPEFGRRRGRSNSFSGADDQRG